MAFGEPSAQPGFTFRDKLVKKTGWMPEHAERTMDEFRRFVFLRVCNGGNSLVPSPDVDEVWHLALQYTKRYAMMCRRFCGGFMHHDPSTSAQEKVALRQRYGNTIRLYMEVFEEKPPADIWALARAVGNECENGCGNPPCGLACANDCGGSNCE